MRLDPTLTPANPGADATGLPQLPRSNLAYARPAPGFVRAMAMAQQNQPTWLATRTAAPTTAPFSANRVQVAAPGASTTGSEGWRATVRAGQTLSGIVREQLAARGVTISHADALRLAQSVARDNQLANPNLIYPGQALRLDGLQTALNGAPPATSTPTTVAATPVQLLQRSDTGQYPVLEKTLDRAVDKGFIPARDRQAVYNKIVQLSVQHRFSPDDFARLTLMESDGMNPKASNNRCHGIIQFCDGPDRGAASAGMAGNPRAILGHSVLQQLDMVDKYFEDTGLRNYGPAGLDDLYLTVLTPAARNETRPNAALSVPGPQAAYLHVNRDTRAPITRNSILAGLHFNANERLRANTEVAQQPPLRPSPNAARLSAYAAQADDTQIR